MRTTNRQRRRGFTLIELLLVMVILVVLAGVVVTRFGNRTEQARDAAAKTDISSIDTALEAFQVDCQRYPTNEEGLACLTRKPSALKQNLAEDQSSWFGPYVDHVPEVDPWGNDYVYRTGDGGRNFELYSAGPGGGEMGFDSRFLVGSQSSSETTP